MSGLAVPLIVLHHGVVGALAPEQVHGGHDGRDVAPWFSPACTGLFVPATAAGQLLGWRLAEQEAVRDGLTGLPTRVLLTRRLDEALAAHRQVSVLFLDLDGFKPVNDAHGHAAGDALLVAVAARLAAPRATATWSPGWGRRVRGAPRRRRRRGADARRAAARRRGPARGRRRGGRPRPGEHRRATSCPGRSTSADALVRGADAAVHLARAAARAASRRSPTGTWRRSAYRSPARPGGAG